MRSVFVLVAVEKSKTQEEYKIETVAAQSLLDIELIVTGLVIIKQYLCLLSRQKNAK